MKIKKLKLNLVVSAFCFLLVQPQVWAFDASILQRSDVNAFDRLAMFPFSESLDVTSKVFTYAALLSPSLLVATPKSEWFSIGIQYAESVALTFGLKEAGKLLITRNRPYMYFDNFPQNKVDNGDFEQSIPSGHSAMAFTGATFTSVMFTQYFPASTWKIPVIAGSYTLATTAAILRNASGNHFVTDIIAGASIGVFSGFIVPFLHTLDFAQTKKPAQSSKTPQSKHPKSSGIQNLSFGIVPAGFIVGIEF